MALWCAVQFPAWISRSLGNAHSAVGHVVHSDLIFRRWIILWFSVFLLVWGKSSDSSQVCPKLAFGLKRKQQASRHVPGFVGNQTASKCVLTTSASTTTAMQIILAKSCNAWMRLPSEPITNYSIFMCKPIIASGRCKQHSRPANWNSTARYIYKYI